jgi:predicted Ser/Thr protein kinase
MTAESDERWRAVQDAIERILLARENAEVVDVLAACGGDQALAAHVRQVLGQGRGLIDDELVDEAATVPKDFGDFEVLRRVGRGGMGTVFLARQKSLGRMVALKVLAPGAIELPSARVRLHREAEVTAALAHPNIVPVYLVGEFGGTPFIAMKYVDGPSLAEVPGPLPPAQVARIGMQVARALAATHAHGVLHRDIKPANLLLDGDAPVIVDFGLARTTGDATLTQEGVVPGTLRYMAPERLGGDGVLDPRIDVYALGATLYWLLAGRDAFAEREPSALVRSILTRDPAPLHLRGRARDLETIVLRALAKEPDRRFASADEFATDLERFLAGQPVRSRRLSLFGHAQRRAAQHPRTTVAIAVATLLLAGAGVWLLTTTAAARADARQRLAIARVDLAAGRWLAAAGTLAALHARDPDDRDVASLLTDARAQVAFDGLLLAIADRSSNADASTLDALTTAATGGDRAFPFAAVLATGHRGGRELGLHALGELPSALRERRAGVALRSWLERSPIPWQLPTHTEAPGTVPASEAIVVALLLRLSGHAPALVRAELAGVDTDVRSQRRVLLLEAIARADAGDLLGAEALLRGIADEFAPKPVWRWLALVQLRLGRTALATAALLRGDDSPSAEYLRLMLRFTTADADEIRSLHDALRNRPTSSAEIERFRWEDVGKRDATQLPEALAQLAALHARQHDDPIGRDLTLATMIETAAWHLPVPAQPQAIVDPAPHDDFLDDWWPRLRELHYPPALATAQEWLAASMCLSGEGSVLPGLELYAQAVELQPLRPRVALAYADVVCALPAATDAAVRTAHLARARRALARIEAAASDHLVLPEDARQRLAWRALLLALHAGDAFEVSHRAAGTRHLTLDESLLRAIEKAAAHVARLRAAATPR